MVRKIVITPNHDCEAQREFTKSFQEKTDINLYEHILVREANGFQYVYTMMDDSCFDILQETLQEFNIDVEIDVDFTEDLKEFYRNSRLCEFVHTNETLSPEEFILDFYSTYVTYDEVLEKISTSGIKSLNALDEKTLIDFSVAEAKKSACC